MRNGSPGPIFDGQNKAAGRAFAIIVLALAGSDLIFLLVAFLIASNMQRRQPPLAAPSVSLLVLFAALGVICLVSSVLWLRVKAGAALRGPREVFQRQVFISIALANADAYLGMTWVLLGGGFLSSVLFFVCPALVLLLLVLPAVRKAAAPGG